MDPVYIVCNRKKYFIFIACLHTYININSYNVNSAYKQI